MVYPLTGASGEVTEVTLMLEDVTERKALEDRLSHQALHDPLTDLPNRTLFLDRLAQVLARSERRRSERGADRDADRHPGQDLTSDTVREDTPPRKGAAVLFLDIDDLKRVNDSLGHDAGDGLLREVAGRIGARLRPADTLARLAGDEFAVLLEGVGKEEAVRAAERITEGVGNPFTVSGQEILVSLSAGIALGGRDAPATGQSAGHEAQVLLRHADVAMYEAKRRGKARHVLYEERMGLEAGARLKLEGDLRRALGRREIEVHYQPKLSLESGLVVGAEALARWRHPERGLLLPAEFIALAEQTGLIVELGYQVLRAALGQAGEWRERWRERRQRAGGAGPPPAVWVNLSARQFREPDLAGRISGILAEAGVEPDALGLEITESILVEDASPSVSLLEDLKRLGVKLAVDDFGTGYSSLSYLTRLPVDHLKIDRSFVAGLGSAARNDATGDTEGDVNGGIGYDTGSAKIVSAVIGLARAMGMKVVAEGVETRGQLSSLREMGCDLAQGYHFARPMPAEEATAYLEARAVAG